MNIASYENGQALKPQQRSGIYWTFADSFTMAKRNLQQIPRVPDELIFST
ncbi:MAG: hypothetical protein H0X24_23465, partial [Ktedonobacterales bacterium]|nr:hypothetical protein [Ktedonobacterales bacterium]